MLDKNNEYVIKIKPGYTEFNYLNDLWRFRDLFYFLAWRDILVRYKQTVIGIAWAVIRPFLTMVVFTIVFSKIAKLPSYGVPYPVLVFCAMLPWQFFSSSMAESSNSLIDNEKLISKVYFPRIIIPASTVIVSLVDFFISFCLLLLLMLWYQFIPSINSFLIIPFLAQAFLAAMGTGLWLCSLNVQFRDFRYIIPFIVQFGLYISPVGFSTFAIPEQWRLLYSLNPMVGVIDGFRWAMLGGENVIYWPGYFTSLIFSLLLFISGFRYFRKTERMFADVI